MIVGLKITGGIWWGIREQDLSPRTQGSSSPFHKPFHSEMILALASHVVRSRVKKGVILVSLGSRAEWSVRRTLDLEDK